MSDIYVICPSCKRSFILTDIEAMMLDCPACGHRFHNPYLVR